MTTASRSRAKHGVTMMCFSLWRLRCDGSLAALSRGGSCSIKATGSPKTREQVAAGILNMSAEEKQQIKELYWHRG